MDLSLRDALTDGKPQMGSESLLKRDFVAGLEAETFDDKVGEKVGKAEYRPLMDRMDGKKEESSFMSGVHMGGMRLEPQGEKGPISTVQQNYSADFLSGPVSMMGMPDQWGSQQMGSKMKDNSMDSFMGFPQTGMGMGMSTGLGVTAVQSGKPSGMAEPPKTSPLFGTEPPKSTQMLGKPNDSNPFNIQDNSVAKDEKMFKQEKADPFSKGDNFNMFEKTDKPEKVEKMDTFEKKEKEDTTKKIENVDKTQKSEKIIKDEDKHDKMEKHDNKAEKSEKVDKPEKTNKEKEEKANTEKTDKAAKAEKNEKAGKGTAKSPTANGNKDLVSPDKAKITVGSTKTSASKTRPNSLSTAESAAAQNRTSSAVKPAADKKCPAPKASTPSSGPKRTTPSEAKAKTPDNGTAQKRPSVSKANGAPASRTTTPKNGAPAGTHTARRSSASKAESKPGEAKKPSTAKTTAARPKTSQTPTPDSATPATTNGTPRRSRITKPPRAQTDSAREEAARPTGPKEAPLRTHA
ncbi:hypothetical protein AALO_G00019140 [Alosa alosa]|uniref:Microtubule-associated protein 4 n=1 Tax=Alosa alosa TaxID=278164 RepID=A0AAV6HL25_9TELE|nr:hypothetical protein AALO_G00019140 [Alosa alosa]